MSVSTVKAAIRQAELGGLEPVRGFLAPGELRIPGRIELSDDERLLVDVGERDRPPKTRTKGVLLQFCGLEGTRPPRILAFARRWGLLGLCEHELPWSHNPPPFPAPPRTGLRAAALSAIKAGHPDAARGILENASDAALSSYCWPMEAEPIEVWQKFAREARALLEIGGTLSDGARGGKPADPELWATVYERSRRMAPWWKRESAPAGERAILARVIDEWMRVGDVRPRPLWAGSRLDVRLEGTGLFGAIARELALTLASIEALGVCEGCGAFYAPRRGQRFCLKPACHRIRERARLRRWRATQSGR